MLLFVVLRYNYSIDKKIMSYYQYLVFRVIDIIIIFISYKIIGLLNIATTINKF